MSSSNLESFEDDWMLEDFPEVPTLPDKLSELVCEA